MSQPKLILRSYGLKSNKGKAEDGFRSIPVADLYIDCRGVVEKGVAGHATGGATTAFQEGVLAGSPASITSMHRLIEDSFQTVSTRRENSDPARKDDPYVICFFCAHGMHRSVACKHLLGERLKKAGYQVEIK
jgi:rhodanese/phosphatase family RapZ-like protein